MGVQPRFLFVAGGTGGHLFPAMAVADRCRALYPDAAIEFVGTRGRIEETAVPRAGYHLNTLWISGFERKINIRALLFPAKVAVSNAQALRLVRRFRPHAVICAGAYVSYPMGVAARLARVPLVLMASDARPGLALTRLAGRASQIHVAFISAEEHFRSAGARCPIYLSGNPTRASLQVRHDRAAARRHFGLDPDRPVLFAFGGSLGARSINAALDASVDKLREHGVQVIWQTGSNYTGGELREPGLYRARFINEMELGYAATDLVLARAGATTAAELAVTGTPSILVPLPIATVHQRQNAEAMEKIGAALMILDDAIKAELLPTVLSLLDDRERLGWMSGAVRSLAVPDADRRIADHLMEFVPGIEHAAESGR